MVETRAVMLFSVLAAILLSALVGPFGTYAAMPFPRRLLYWAAVVVISLGVAHFTGRVLLARIHNAGWRRWVGLCLRTGLVALVISGLIDALNRALWEGNPAEFPNYGNYLRIIWPTVFVITSIITFVMARHIPAQKATPQGQHGEAVASAFLARVPTWLGNRLLWLKMQDHYIEVATEKGQHLLLLRFSVAIEELADYDGMRIHRSYWVARRAVRGVHRQGRRMVLRLQDGSELPVSRSYVAAVRRWLNV